MDNISLDDARREIQERWRAQPAAERTSDNIARFFIDLQQREAELLSFGTGKGPLAWRTVQGWLEGETPD